MSRTKNIKSKQQLILEAAQKRFAIYGVEKTTMQEIADDLRLVKGSLYYYFPDKENLFKAVIETEQAEFLKVIEEDIEKIKEPSEALRKYVLNRLSYFRKLVNLSRLRAESLNEYRPMITESMVKFREKERNIVKKIFDRGNDTGEFDIPDTLESASLFLDLLKGLRSAILNDKKLLSIDEDEYKTLTDKALTFADIFINGLLVNKGNKFHKLI
jgi:AcrR family transcriptional regulator